MEQKELNSELILKWLDQHRKMLKIVKVLPFVYVGLFILSAINYFLFGDIAIVDGFCYISPFPIFANLLMSHVCNYCNWHKAVCLLMFVTPASIILINCFNEYILYDSLVTITISMSIVSLVGGFIVFRKKPIC